MAGVSPYKTAIDLKRPAPDWIPNELDKERVQAYNTYWDVYWNVTEAFQVVLRDDEGDEISRRLVPAARTIIEATNRYLGKNPVVTPMPLAIGPDGSEIQVDPSKLQQIVAILDDFYVREEFFTKFGSMKRWMLIRGDALLHLTADSEKLEGQRLRLVELDPATYFPIRDPNDEDRVIGAYIVNLISNDTNDGIIAQRQAYLKTETGTIFTKLDFFEKDKWDDRWPLSKDDTEPVDAPERLAGLENLIEGFELDSRITSIPVYHYRNRCTGGLRFGISELQGIETLLAGIIQTATDEDIAMSQTGVGIFVTTSGSPRNPTTGAEEPWVIAPASVLELETTEDRFERVQGITTVQPLLDHQGMLEAQARRTTATPDIAVGTVDVKVAESGIALAIQMAPILAKNEETERELKTRTEQLLFDILTMWLPVFEGIEVPGLRMSVMFDDPLPIDRAAVLKEILDMLAAKVITIGFAGQLIKERLGIKIPDDMVAQLASENQTLLDSVGGRLGAEDTGAGASDPGAV